jgi:hypothetical protein
MVGFAGGRFSDLPARGVSQPLRRAPRDASEGFVRPVCGPSETARDDTETSVNRARGRAARARRKQG